MAETLAGSFVFFDNSGYFSIKFLLIASKPLFSVSVGFGSFRIKLTVEVISLIFLWKIFKIF